MQREERPYLKPTSLTPKGHTEKGDKYFRRGTTYTGGRQADLEREDLPWLYKDGCVLHTYEGGIKK